MVDVLDSVLADLIAHAQGHPTQEVCGVLAGRGDRVARLYHATNRAANPRIRFELDAGDLFRAQTDIEARGLELIGFYHSHVHTTAFPSPTDVDVWAQTWGPYALCFICSLADEERPIVRTYRIDWDLSIEELPIVPRAELAAE